MVRIANRLRDRVYADFLMASRLGEYRALLETALASGYEVCSVGGFWRRARMDALTGRYVVLRHDVDTDPGTARAMWAIDRDLGVESSYFFRLSTLDERLMEDIHAAGSEASYHYEELATIARRRRVRTRAAALQCVPEASDRFAANLERIRRATALPMRVVASHGDFVNRRLGVANWVILDDPDLRRSLDIQLETYDEQFLQSVTSRHSDGPYPRFWEWDDPWPAIQAGNPVVSILVHPRHWRVNRATNAKDDVVRVIAELRYALPL